MHGFHSCSFRALQILEEGNKLLNPCFLIYLQVNLPSKNHPSKTNKTCWDTASKPTRVSSSLIGCPFHMALYHI